MLIIIITPDIFPACFLLDKLRDNVGGSVGAHSQTVRGVLCMRRAVQCDAVRRRHICRSNKAALRRRCSDSVQGSVPDETVRVCVVSLLY